MEEYIRQLTHDNQLFESQWPETYNKLHKLWMETPADDQVHFKVKASDALVDYVLADTEEILEKKLTFLKITMEKFRDEPLPSLDGLVRIFCRILEIKNINNFFHFSFLQLFYSLFQLGQRLSSLPSVDLTEKILNYLEKYDFADENFNDNQMQEKWEYFLSRTVFSSFDSDRNKLTFETTMTTMRTRFQQFYRYAAQHSSRSKIWLEVQQALARACRTLFESFTNPDDAELHLIACTEPPVSRDYIELITKFYKNHADAFQKNLLQIYPSIEKLVLQNNIKEVEFFMSNVIIPNYNSITDLEQLLQVLIRTCSTVHIDSRNHFCHDFIIPITYVLDKKKPNKKFAVIFFDFLLSILDLYVMDAPSGAYRLLYISEFYPWKQLDKRLTHLVQSCSAYDQICDDSQASKLENLEKILHLIQERAKTNPTIYNATHQIALQSLIKWSSSVIDGSSTKYGQHVLKMGQEMTELVDQKQLSVDIYVQLIDILQKRLDNNDELENLNYVTDEFLTRIMKLISETIQQLKPIPIILNEKFVSYCLTSFNLPFNTENGAMTYSHLTALYIWFKAIAACNNDDDTRLYLPCADRLYQLVCEENEESLYTWWLTFWSIVATKYPNVAIERISQFLHEAFDRKRFDLITVYPTLYEKQPEPFHARLDDLIHVLFDDNAQHFSSLISLFTVIVKNHPEIITSSQMDYIFTSLKTLPDSFRGLSYLHQAFGYIATAQPDLFDKHQNEFLTQIKDQKDLTAFLAFQQYLLASSIIHGEEKANEYLNLLLNLLKTTKNLSADITTQIFHTCQMIGVKYKQSLANKREDLLAYKSNSACSMLIDIVDGNKMSEEHQAAINNTLDEMAQIEQRVTHTEHDLRNVTKIVKHQELNITNLGNRVDIVDTKVNDLTEQVEYHSQEIERIDNKTLSYVPTIWGRDVCRLLNIRANNDWRLLGKRFGYSSSELKHWAMQQDPTMSLLNEWFMTHKADEATYGLVKMLHEIGREDVEEIIRKAVTAAGDLIPDDLPMEIKRLPSIFLSYQWGSQQAVLKLKTNLEQAGYACWMDIGQMGGGDKLFAQIDAGIRGAKVVICCMNKAYAQSDNCLREVHLTISTGKTLIPLQMEKQTWPPEGALGPIMSEYLYIRFFDRKNNDPDFWPADRFAELLGQIRYYVAPDPDMITEPYHNWFVPRVDNLIFLQPTTTTATTNGNQDKTTISDKTPLVITHPQIMISYQWDNQKDIVKLYEKLTQLGYRCWLDIFQMGGGDSLFEKIDTGIRNAKCILSCLTPKYTKSINCRREMALSDALKKPILPLLLEQTSTWPPSGPMAMVFAEKPFIDFQNIDSNQERWISKSYELLLARLKQYIPEVQTDKPQRHLLDMQRPTTAIKREEIKSKRVRSAPVTPQSRACSIM